MIATRFRDYFASWRIELPADDIRERRAGYISEKGWLIQYRFGTNAGGDYLDFYAAHRMTDDRHVRLFASGRSRALATIESMRLVDPDPEKDRALEARYLRRNRRIASVLVRKGFDRFTINMALHTGMDT